jgi:hypothetical protein
VLQEDFFFPSRISTQLYLVRLWSATILPRIIILFSFPTKTFSYPDTLLSPSSYTRQFGLTNPDICILPPLTSTGPVLTHSINFYDFLVHISVPISSSNTSFKELLTPLLQTLAPPPRKLLHGHLFHSQAHWAPNRLFPWSVNSQLIILYVKQLSRRFRVFPPPVDRKTLHSVLKIPKTTTPTREFVGLFPFSWRLIMTSVLLPRTQSQQMLPQDFLLFLTSFSVLHSMQYPPPQILCSNPFFKPSTF